MYYFYGKINQGHVVHCMEVVNILESPLWEVLVTLLLNNLLSVHPVGVTKN